ncbi:RNA polymerase III RPC4-domain-containing protein [Trametes gibbosa]|nr:RNA polymerase III RPC4-domain-containing protein [Trametes gibbosa]
MSEQPSGRAGPSGSGSGTPKAIASLAKKQGDVTRLGTQKLKFVPTLPARRRPGRSIVTEDPAPSSSSSDRGRGRGSDRGARSRGRGQGGEGRGGAPSARAAAAEMTASGPFAMGPALVGTSARRSAPRSNFAPIVPQGPGGGVGSRLGAGLTQTGAPTLKREPYEAGGVPGAGAGVRDDEVYSDPDEGVEIVDMENVRQMDWMAPESLRKEREVGKKGARVKKEEKAEGRIQGAYDAMNVDRTETPEEEQVNVANAVDLSESEDEEELEDIIDDFANARLANEESDIRQERLYFFQFPNPFPVFCSPQGKPAESKSKEKVNDGGDETSKKVTFADDTKPPAAAGVSALPSEKSDEQPKLDGVVGQLEIYESGTVKLRLGNGILLDVAAATQPSFLQHAVYVDTEHKQLCVLGEVNRRFVVTPDLDALLAGLDVADNPPTFDLGEGLLTMDSA